MQGTNSASLEARVGELLRALGQTVSTAESCTGGLIAHLLTNVPGSSAYVMGGIVAYDNSIKTSVLNVREFLLREYGAVSEEVAAEMAHNVRGLMGTDYGISVTGIAGPGGGTPQKPVGLTYIGLAGPGTLLVVERHLWDGDREGNKRASAFRALEMLHDVLFPIVSNNTLT